MPGPCGSGYACSSKGWKGAERKGADKNPKPRSRVAAEPGLRLSPRLGPDHAEAERPIAGYQVGKFEVYRLLRERGDRFDLGEFHDALLATGMIPISLVRWEMTGSDEDVDEPAKKQN